MSSYMNKSFCWQLLPVLLLLTACSHDDNYRYPSVKAEYLTVFSGKSGRVQSVLTDGGKTYPIFKATKNATIRPDSSARIVGQYEVTTEADGTEGVNLYTCQPVISPFPLPANHFKGGVKTDPADVLGIWMGLDYLNITLTVKAQREVHLFHFVEDAVKTDEETGLCNISLTLYHDAKNDVQAYTRRIYLSVPLRRYITKGVRQVKVHFCLHTNAGSIKTYSFDYIPR